MDKPPLKTEQSWFLETTWLPPLPCLPLPVMWLAVHWVVNEPLRVLAALMPQGSRSHLRSAAQHCCLQSEWSFSLSDRSAALQTLLSSVVRQPHQPNKQACSSIIILWQKLQSYLYSDLTYYYVIWVTMTYFNRSHIITQVFNMHFICIQGRKFTFFVLASAYTVTSEWNQKGPSAPLKLQP